VGPLVAKAMHEVVCKEKRVLYVTIKKMNTETKIIWRLVSCVELKIHENLSD
jgi:hypothetical protein